MKTEVASELVKIAKEVLGDSVEDIATDIVHRLGVGMEMKKAFESTGNGYLYWHTRATELADDFDVMSFDKRVKAMGEVIKKSLRRYKKSLRRQGKNE